MNVKWSRGVCSDTKWLTTEDAEDTEGEALKRAMARCEERSTEVGS